MDGFEARLLLLWALAALAIENNVEAMEHSTLVINAPKAIPHNNKTNKVTKLEINNSQIALNEEDRKALATYGDLEELRLDGNLVTAIPARYFSVVPKLRVLSLSRNHIISLDPEAFFGLNVLAELDLSQNQLTSFPPRLFKCLNSLKMLKLQNNPWNCSCPLLVAIQEVKQANIHIGRPKLTCTSSEMQAGNDLRNSTALCLSSALHTPNNDSQKMPTRVNSQQSWVSSTTLNTTVLPSQNSSTSKDQTPVLGNAWKFTACVAALAITTLMLITLAFKGPSWYKLYYNYRHRRLDPERDEGKDVATGSSTRYRRQQTFMFEQGNRQLEEGEDGDEYFEDPYIKKEELQVREENLTEP